MDQPIRVAKNPYRYLCPSFMQRERLAVFEPVTNECEVVWSMTAPRYSRPVSRIERRLIRQILQPPVSQLLHLLLHSIALLDDARPTMPVRRRLVRAIGAFEPSSRS